jgi:DNA-binding winged helix-turn-helix (wHTH) protein
LPKGAYQEIPMSQPQLQPAEQPHSQYRFGEFLLDLTGGFLHRSGEEVTLPPKPFDVLIYDSSEEIVG